MIFKKNLVLVGMMGSGKSTIGRKIAKKLKLDFIDIDKEIERHEKMSVSQIFFIKGENYFRNLEEKVVLDKLRLKAKIISLGGGSFINKNVRKNIIKNHISVWLNWDKFTLIERIIKNDKRPLVNKLTQKELLKMIKERSAIYNKSHFKLDCENLDKETIENKLIKIYESKQN